MGKIIINEYQLNQLVNLVSEQISGSTDNFGDSSDFCNVNVKNEINTSFPTENNVLIKSIQDAAKLQLSNSVTIYKNWYNKPETQKKITKKSLLKTLPSFLDKLLSKPIAYYTDPSKSPKPKSIAWVMVPSVESDVKLLGDKWGVININVYQLHDGKNYLNSLYDVIHHEMGHIIDSYFRVNGENIYLKTHDNYNRDDYEKNYIINDKDQFSRLSVLRTAIGAGPMDDPKSLLDKFMSKVKEGKISSPYFNFSTAKGQYTPSTFKKNTTEVAKSLNMYLTGRIFIGELSSKNVEQLFSNFSFAKRETDTIYVNFNLLSDLNKTTADIDKENNSDTLTITEKIFKKSKMLLEIEDLTTFYFLALKPKEGKLTISTISTPEVNDTPVPPPPSSPSSPESGQAVYIQ